MTMPARKAIDPIRPWTAFWLAVSVSIFAAGMFALAHDWQPRWAAYGVFPFAGLYLYFGARPLIDLRLSKNRDLRKTLIALAAQRQGEWLNRDEHLIFTARHTMPHPLRTWIIVRMSEDSVLEVETDAQTVITYERFILMPFTVGPYHFDEASLVTAKDTKDTSELRAGKMPGEPGLFTYLRRTSQMSKAGLGPRASTASEVRELIRQLEEAEPMFTAAS